MVDVTLGHPDNSITTRVWEVAANSADNLRAEMSCHLDVPYGQIIRFVMTEGEGRDPGDRNHGTHKLAAITRRADRPGSKPGPGTA